MHFLGNAKNSPRSAPYRTWRCHLADDAVGTHAGRAADLREYSVITLLMVASTGNILDSCIIWWLGLYIEHFHDWCWFPVKLDALEKASA
jgi:hypothetical protein